MSQIDRSTTTIIRIDPSSEPIDFVEFLGYTPSRRNSLAPSPPSPKENNLLGGPLAPVADDETLDETLDEASSMAIENERRDSVASVRSEWSVGGKELRRASTASAISMEEFPDDIEETLKKDQVRRAAKKKKSVFRFFSFIDRPPSIRDDGVFANTEDQQDRRGSDSLLVMKKLFKPPDSIRQSLRRSRESIRASLQLGVKKLGFLGFFKKVLKTRKSQVTRLSQIQTQTDK